MQKFNISSQLGIGDSLISLANFLLFKDVHMKSSTLLDFIVISLAH